jgi:hypothetical protein
LVLSQPLLELRCPSQTVIRSSEGLLHLKGDLVPQHVITGPCQLVGHRLNRYQPVGPFFLALIEALHFRVVTDGEVRRLHKGPGQILVPILGVAATLAFAAGKKTYGQKCRVIYREALRSLLELCKRYFAEGKSCDEVLEVLMPT